jgi:hypothetical protein
VSKDSKTILHATFPDLTVWKDPDSSEWILLVDWEIFSGLLPTEEFPSAISSELVPPRNFSQLFSELLAPFFLRHLAKCRPCAHLATGFFQLNPLWATVHSLQQFLHTQLFLLNNMTLSVFLPTHTLRGPLHSLQIKLQVISPELLSQNRLCQRTPCRHYALLAYKSFTLSLLSF